MFHHLMQFFKKAMYHEFCAYFEFLQHQSTAARVRKLICITGTVETEQFGIICITGTVETEQFRLICITGTVETEQFRLICDCIFYDMKNLFVPTTSNYRR